MTIIIAHIDGPSGGGKTTIGNIINNKYPFVKNIDIDDILFRDLPCMFPLRKTLQFFIKFFLRSRTGLQRDLII